MINFKPIAIEDKKIYEPFLHDGTERGCEYSFTNLFLWGNQQAAIYKDHLVLFSEFNNRRIYPYPLGKGEKKPVIDALMDDAKERNIPFYLSGLYGDARQTLEELYPDKFQFHSDPDSYDYVYAIDDLADLKGKKYHRKKNHFNRFRNTFPDYTVQPLTVETLCLAREMADIWYHDRLSESPENDYQLEQTALNKALLHFEELNMEGLLLLHDEKVLAFTIGSRLSDTTFDIHFEKARWDVNGAYTAINCEFARYLRSKYPKICFLDREDDMGLEGLRKAKQSYYPHHMVEKCFAGLQ